MWPTDDPQDTRASDAPEEERDREPAFDDHLGEGRAWEEEETEA